MVGPNARALPQGFALRHGAPILCLDSVQQAVDEAQQQDDEDRARDHPDPLEPAIEDLSHEPTKQIGDSTDEAGPNEAVDDLVQCESQERELRQAECDGADQPQAVQVLQQQDGGHGTGFDQPLDLGRTGPEGSRTQSELAPANRPARREPEHMSEPSTTGGGQPDAYGVEHTLCRERRCHDEDALPFEQRSPEHSKQTVFGNQTRDGASSHGFNYMGPGAWAEAALGLRSPRTSAFLFGSRRSLERVDTP